MEHKLLERAGRYAVIKRENDTTPYVSCCGYCDKTRTWNQGYYFATLEKAMTDYKERVSWACCDCEHRNTKEHPTWCMK